MRRSRIRAVDYVVREAAMGLSEALRWFYVDVAGLDEVPGNPGHRLAPGRAWDSAPGSALYFRARQQEVQVRMVPNPVVDASGFPIVIAVVSLDEAAALLGEGSVAFETLSGVSWPDRRLVTSDPAGNRVELKREWPYDPL